MIINIAIVDDSKTDIRAVKSAISSAFYGTEILVRTRVFVDPNDSALLQRKYDVYILDIDMDGSETRGFELSAKIKENYPTTVIMFCSNHDDLVFDSFKLNTFYFIRKQDRLTEDIKAAFIKYIDMLSNDTYIAKNKSGIYKILLKDVLYFEVSHNDLYIHFVNGKEIKERKQIAIVYDEVKNKGFVMIGKSFVVNTKYIISINKSQRSVTLTNRQTIQMTVKQLEEFKHFFDNSQGEINNDI